MNFKICKLDLDLQCLGDLQIFKIFCLFFFNSEPFASHLKTCIDHKGLLQVTLTFRVESVFKLNKFLLKCLKLEPFGILPSSLNLCIHYMEVSLWGWMVWGETPLFCECKKGPNLLDRYGL